MREEEEKARALTHPTKGVILANTSANLFPLCSSTNIVHSVVDITRPQRGPRCHPRDKIGHVWVSGDFWSPVRLPPPVTAPRRAKVLPARTLSSLGLGFSAQVRRDGWVGGIRPYHASGKLRPRDNVKIQVK